MDQRKMQILHILEQTYPNPKTALNHDSPFQLLIATILSAQCTDKRVNIITQQLFRDYPDCSSLAKLGPEEIAEYIRSAGLWKAKAANIHRTCQMLLSEYDGQIPSTREELEKLPGVGRKTANVVLANAFNVPAIAVDTHVQRVANRLGLANAKTPLETERQLMAAIPEEQWADAHHWLIYHGRQICMAKNPHCDDCPLNKLCPAARV